MNLMKKVFGVLVCILLAGVGLLVVPGEAGRQASADAAGTGHSLSNAAQITGATLTYEVYGGTSFIFDGERNIASRNSKNYLHLYDVAGGDGWGAMLGGNARFVADVPTSQVLHIDGAFAPAVVSGGDPVFGTTNIVTYRSATVGEKTGVPTYEIFYAQIGIYKIDIYLYSAGQDRPASPAYTFYSVCKSGKPSFSARITAEGSTGTYENSISLWRPKDNAVSLTIQLNSTDTTYYERNKAETTIASGITIKDSAGETVETDTVFSDVVFDTENDKISLQIAPGTALLDRYTLTFDVEYVMSVVDKDGNVSYEKYNGIENPDRKPITIAVALDFADRPVDNTLMTLLLGVLILGLIGGALWGIGLLARRSQTRHEVKIYQQMEDKARRDNENLERLRAQMETQEQELADMKKETEQKTSKRKKKS
jgi:hypothetical protein